MTLFWMSFADPLKMPGSQFLGLVILDAESLSDALDKAGEKGIIPGGMWSLKAYHLPEEDRALYTGYMNRLLTEPEAMEIGDKFTEKQ